MTASLPAPVELAELPPRCAPQTLWQRYHDTSDLQSEEALVQQYLPLVKTVVGRLAMTLPVHLDLDELRGAGIVGLLHAIRHFNPASGTSFETYARFRIRGEVLDELRRLDPASRTVREKARRIENAIVELEQRTGTMPEEGEVAAHLNLPLSVYHRWLDDVRPTTFVCLDSITHYGNDDEGGHTVLDTVSDPLQEGPDELAVRREMAEMIAGRIRRLPEMQRKVLSLYYYEDLRLAEIAEVFGITESRVSQIHAQAILTIRSFVLKVMRGSAALGLPCK
jgi:RNA polymerase sigma factor for flagellar operon FliA